jgi:hypothetical protein
MGLIFRNEADPPMRQVRINNSAMAWTGLDWYCMSHTGVPQVLMLITTYP